jgi:phosphoribosyl-AMP cyclohydrolase
MTSLWSECLSVNAPDTPLLASIQWNNDGLVPAIVQDAETLAVLMMAWMDRHALSQTLATGQTHFYSRSRRKSWHKGETSGHVQHVESVWIDCDADVVLIKARQVGGACHEGYHSCFFRRAGGDGHWETVGHPVFEPEAVYRPISKAGEGQTPDE